jgi:5'-nucleotidase
LVIDARIDARGFAYYWIGFRRQVGKPGGGTDLAAVAKRAIAVTPLQLNLTEQRTALRLRQALRSRQPARRRKAPA